MCNPIIQMKEVTKRFDGERGEAFYACQGVTMEAFPRETLGIVGESGCGKTTLLKMLMTLLPVTSGSILFEGVDVTTLRGEARRQYFRNIQMVSQDPSGAFNPKMKVKDIICEPLRNFGLIKSHEVVEKATELLRQVELSEAFLHRYPHELSGGQKQRVAIARALALDPKVLVCDEATSALDVSVQDRIIQLLVKLQRERGLTMLFICHDLALINLFAHRIVVMHEGRVVEVLEGGRIIDCKDPYTKSLVESVFDV